MDTKKFETTSARAETGRTHTVGKPEANPVSTSSATKITPALRAELGKLTPSLAAGIRAHVAKK